MAFFGSVKEGWSLLVDSVRFLFKKPIFLVPLFLAWTLVASLILYLRYYWEPPGGFLTLLMIFLFVFFIALVISVCNIVMLEFMQQLETNGKISITKALKEAVVIDLVRVIPVALIWAAVWFVILIIKALLSKKRKRESPEPSMEDAAMTLAGANSGPFSWLKLGLGMFEKLLRMYVFLTLPAIAWENAGPFSAFRKSFEVIRKHPVQFLTSYTLTTVTSVLMALPLLPVVIAVKADVSFPAVFWTVVLLYEGIIWSADIYLEQMSVGLLYLWHLKWVKHGSKGELSSVKKPDLLDNVYELKA